MPLKAKDLDVYRKDERIGHKLLTPEERIKFIKPYLPTPPPPPSKLHKADAGKVRRGRIGVRRFLRRNFHLFVFTSIHFFFSLYIRARQAYHAISDRISSILKHHHHNPQLIESDVKHLSRLPTHLSVILTLEDGGRGLEKLLNDAADIAAWCASAGIPQLSIYEKTGMFTFLMQSSGVAC